MLTPQGCNRINELGHGRARCQEPLRSHERISGARVVAGAGLQCSLQQDGRMVLDDDGRGRRLAELARADDVIPASVEDVPACSLAVAVARDDRARPALTAALAAAGEWAIAEAVLLTVRAMGRPPSSGAGCPAG